MASELARRSSAAEPVSVPLEAEGSLSPQILSADSTFVVLALALALAWPGIPLLCDP